MGVVVAARHEQLDQTVALKFVRDEALNDDEAVQRFLREARAAVKLKSEHVARVIDVGTLDSGAPYMVMEYLEGSDLGSVLAAHGPLAVEEVADWIVQACEAIAEAHAAGIVHRDLKPENLFLARTVGGAARIKVLDFGISKSVQSLSGGVGGLTRTRAMLGSPLYMAPEQMRSSRDVDARADVWALGVVIYELLTKELPFEAETMPELCFKVVSDPPRPLAPSSGPSSLARAGRCGRALPRRSDPSKRFCRRRGARVGAPAARLADVAGRRRTRAPRQGVERPPAGAHVAFLGRLRPPRHGWRGGTTPTATVAPEGWGSAPSAAGPGGDFSGRARAPGASRPRGRAGLLVALALIFASRLVPGNSDHSGASPAASAPAAMALSVAVFPSPSSPSASSTGETAAAPPAMSGASAPSASAPRRRRPP